MKILEALEMFGELKEYTVVHARVKEEEAEILFATVKWPDGSVLRLAFTEAIPAYGLWKVEVDKKVILEAIEWGQPESTDVIEKKPAEPGAAKETDAPPHPMRDIKVVLTDGSFHAVDSSEIAFKIAGSMAFREACRKAGLVLLEPVMRVEVTAPDDYMGDLIGDLNSRRGHIQSMEPRQGFQIIRARVPMSEMFGYATDVRSSTQGRGNYSMHFYRYEEVPKAIGEEVVARISGTLGR